MSKKNIDIIIKLLAAAFFIIVVFLLFNDKGNSDKLTDLNRKETDALVESIQGSFAEEGWTYTGYEIEDSDKENDTETVLISYDVKGDPKDLLKKHAEEKPANESVYNLADNINVKVAVKLSVYDKEYDTIGSSVESTRWYVGDTEVNTWIKEQNDNLQ